jgi:hypothetical protein
MNGRHLCNLQISLKQLHTHRQVAVRENIQLLNLITYFSEHLPPYEKKYIALQSD